MTRPNDPAFPINSTHPQEEGITKREYFAAIAMQGILASPDFIDQAVGEDLPKFAVQWADDLISALNREENDQT